MRLGIFGGSFDPVHFGHLLLAEYCRDECSLDQVWFVPAAVPPHKQERTLSSGEHRLEMLKLAIAGYEPFVASDMELKRSGVSYTVDTLAALKTEDSQRELFFLMGADSLAELPTWREPERVCELAVPVVVRRVCAPEPDFTCLKDLVSPARLAEIKGHQVAMPLVELSSREIRRRVSEGQSIRFQTPRAIEKYIETHGLYR